MHEFSPAAVSEGVAGTPTHRRPGAVAVVRDERVGALEEQAPAIYREITRFIERQDCLQVSYLLFRGRASAGPTGRAPTDRTTRRRYWPSRVIPVEPDCTCRFLPLSQLPGMGFTIAGLRLFGVIAGEVCCD